jgi:alpha-beta hydrolase superfamily lysophospholipase
MGLFFDDPLHEMFAANVALGLASRGGSEPGEIVSTCTRITDGDDSSWFDEWYAAAERIAAGAHDSAAAGHRVSAREGFLRAASYYMLAYRPLIGSPVDPRLTDAFAKQQQSFDHVAALHDAPAEPIAVPLDGATMPGWFFAAGERRAPTIVATNGYDMTMPELFLGVARSALRRGYHCVVFDGPGQGRMLVEQQVTMRPDWEQVVTPVLDAVLARPDVDPARVALAGWSLGGYLALRAASGEPRFAACIADPGLFGIRESMLARLRAMQVPESVIAAYPDLPADVLEPMEQMAATDRIFHWSMARRGYWVHGVDSVADYVRATADFSLAGRLGNVRFPTLVTQADADPLSATADLVVAGLTSCPVELVSFTAAEGAGDHCEWLDRSRFDQRAFDWLDEQLAPRSSPPD